MQLTTNQLKLQRQGFLMTLFYVFEVLKGFFMIRVANLKMSCFTSLMKPLEYPDCVPRHITQ